MLDSLGDRMKKNYENPYRIMLPRRTNLILRIDGKAFHSLTKQLPKPYSLELMGLFDETTQYCLKEFQGAKLAYAQSDEVSFWLTDYDGLTTNAWFDNNLQKIVSVAASTFTMYFNLHKSEYIHLESLEGAKFDCRAFIVPELNEVTNYFLWRHQDAVRNSIQMAARSEFSHGKCLDKSCIELQNMLYEIGKPWDKMSSDFKNGRLFTTKEQIDIDAQLTFSAMLDILNKSLEKVV